jgi:hypothetical protein
MLKRRLPKIENELFGAQSETCMIHREVFRLKWQIAMRGGVGRDG